MIKSRYELWLPRALRSDLIKAAVKEKRTLSKHIIFILEKYIEDKKLIKKDI